MSSNECTSCAQGRPLSFGTQFTMMDEAATVQPGTNLKAHSVQRLKALGRCSHVYNITITKTCQ